MDFTARVNCLISAGRYIAQRVSYNHKISLYALHSFYVEAHYLPNENQVNRIESVNNETVLTLYVPDIELEDLL